MYLAIYHDCLHFFVKFRQRLEGEILLVEAVAPVADRVPVPRRNGTGVRLCDKTLAMHFTPCPQPAEGKWS